MQTKPATATRLRGVYLGVTDMDRSRSFYELVGAHFDDDQPFSEDIVHATLGGIRLIFEPGHPNPPRKGAYLLFDVTDADVLHDELERAGCTIAETPRNEPWGRQFDVLDPDGYPIAFIGPAR